MRDGVRFINIEIKPSAADYGKVEGLFDFPTLLEQSSGFELNYV